jgi:uncharacterized protein YjbI with pentapeptide repeats
MLKKIEPVDENITKTTGKKRGRKSKKELEEAEKLLNKQSDNIINENIINENIVNENIVNENIVNENIVVTIQETHTIKDNDINCIHEVINSDNEENIDLSDILGSPEKCCEQLSANKPVTKKRGRKPKGGKIIQQIMPLNNTKETKPNVILHLKCSLKDLKSTNLFGSNLDGYSFSHANNL